VWFVSIVVFLGLFVRVLFCRTLRSASLDYSYDYANVLKSYFFRQLVLGVRGLAWSFRVFSVCALAFSSLGIVFAKPMMEEANGF